MKGARIRHKAVADAQGLCGSYGKGARGSPMNDNFTEIFTELTWKPEYLVW